MLKSTTYLFLLFLLGACSSFTVEKEFNSSPEIEALRPIQSRLFRTADRAALTTAAAEALKEMGFSVEQQEPGLGFVSAHQRVSTMSVVAALRISASLLLSVLVRDAVTLGGSINDHDVFHATFVTMPGTDERVELVRLTLQRVEYTSHDRITDVESVDKPQVYADFFKRVQDILENKKIVLQEVAL